MNSKLLHERIFWLLAFFTLVRLAVSGTFGLGVDEAHYVLYAKHLALSYFDHPPLVGWLHAPIYYTLGTNEFLARVPAIALFAAASWLCYRFILRLGACEKTALLAVAALNGSFLLNALSFMLLPDGILFVLIFMVIFSVLKLERAPTTKNYILFGATLGLCGLAKYTAVLFIPAIALYFLLKKRYALFYSTNILLAILAALIVISPVLIWNVQNDFASFTYQSGHVLNGSGVDKALFFRSLVQQFGAYSPPLFLISLYGFYKSARSSVDELRLAALLGGAVLAFFVYSSLFKPALPHWSSPFFVLFIPVGAYFMTVDATSLKTKLLHGAIIFSVAVTLLLYGELAFKFFRFADFKSPFRDIYGYDEAMHRADAILSQNPNPHKALAVTNWTVASRAMYYSLLYKSEVFLIDPRKDQFYFWRSRPPEGLDLLFVNSHFFNKDILTQMNCAKTESAGSHKAMLNGGIVDEFSLIWCYGFSGEKVAK